LIRFRAGPSDFLACLGAGPPDLECLTLVSGGDILLFVVRRVDSESETSISRPAKKEFPIDQLKRRRTQVKVFRSFEDQEASDIQYYIGLSPEARQRIARVLRKRFYGKNPPRIRSAEAAK